VCIRVPFCCDAVYHLVIDIIGGIGIAIVTIQYARKAQVSE
jgi:hypothetical protein